jgi:hypothetical protein
MTETRFCSKCGTALPAGAQFCSSCGAPAAAPAVPPPVSHTPPVAASRSVYLIWVPIAVVALALLAWAVLSGMPFGREPQQPKQREMDVIEEKSESAASTSTVARIGDPDPAPPQRQPALTVTTRPKREPGEVGEGEALASLRRYLLSRPDYNLSDSCLSISPLGYRNAGYTFHVSDRCGGASFGRWRVDAEDPSGVFRQHPDGRYLKP